MSALRKAHLYYIRQDGIILQAIDKESVKCKFNENIYEITVPVFITSNDFWDGGIDSGASLKEKARFYSLAATMSAILKDFISVLNEDAFISDFLCENKRMYAEWSNLKEIELFRIITKAFKKNKCYKLSLTEDSKIIDLIIESNFKYYSFFSLFFPEANIIVQPTCHTELIIYSENTEYVKDIFKKIIKSYAMLRQGENKYLLYCKE